MYRSMEALCRTEVAQRFAATPTLADQPPPRASFDCNTAHAPLEKAICADPKLGRADLVLSRVFSQALQSLTPDEQRMLNADERKWMAKVVADCQKAEAGAPDQRALACAKTAFEARFTAVGECRRRRHDQVSGGAELARVASSWDRPNPPSWRAKRSHPALRGIASLSLAMTAQKRRKPQQIAA